MGKNFGQAVDDRLHDEFVGRQEALSWLAAPLVPPATAPQVRWCYAPGGTGKTALLRRFSQLSQDKIASCHWIDGDTVQPHRAAVVAAVSEQNGHSLEKLGRTDNPDLLVIDTFEKFEPMQAWMVREWLPTAGPNLYVAVGSREPPPGEWTQRLGSTLTAMQLPNLTLDEARQQMARSKVPPERHDELIDVTRGHALSLSLICSHAKWHKDALTGENANDLMQSLVAVLLRGDVKPAHLRALNALTLPQALDQQLLSVILDVADVTELYRFLQNLPFVKSTPTGLVLHDLVREAIHGDFVARFPDRVAEFAGRASRHTMQRARGAEPAAVATAFAESLFVHRHIPPIGQQYYQNPLATHTVDSRRDGDDADLFGLVDSLYGKHQLDRAHAWFGHAAADVVVLRDAEPNPAACLVRIRGEEVPRAELKADEVCRAALAGMERAGWDPSSGDSFDIFRFLFSRRDVAPGSPAVGAAMAAGPYVMQMGDRPVRWLVYPVPHPERWRGHAPNYFLTEFPDVQITVDGTPFGVFVADLFAGGFVGPHVPPKEWVWTLTAGLVERMSMGGAPQLLGAPSPAPSLPAEDFDLAVRAALRDLHRLPVLRKSPLVEVFGESPEALQAHFLGLLDAMQSNPAYEESGTTLRATYLNPERKRRAVAAELQVPFGTYRHRLRKAVDAFVAHARMSVKQN